MQIVGNFFDGKKEDIKISNDEIYLNIFNPSTGENIKKVKDSNLNDFNNIIKSSKAGFYEWSKYTPLKRSRIIANFKKILEDKKKDLAEIICEEHGKTFDDAIGSITRGIEVVEFVCGIPHLLKGEFSQNVGTDIDSWSIRQPIGITVGITPFNFPAMVPLWMFPVSIACGNAFILKPSEKNPSCSIKMAEYFTDAGLPDGVLNIMNGGAKSVNMLLESKDINSISFVGSTNVAEYIYSTAAKNKKRVQALGGAKNHLVVMPDADLNQAVDGIIGASFGSAGERCMAVSVAVAVGDIANDLVKKIKNKAEILKVSPWTDEKSDMGPLISSEHLKKVNNYIDTGINEGAKIILDGRNLQIQGYEKGYFIGPTIFDDVKEDMQIYKDEIFGPVLSVVRVDSYEKALEIINNHKFGNGTCIYTSSGEISRHFSTNTKIGMVGVNVPIPVPMAFHSFGGWKESLFGANGMHGTDGINFYTKLKTVTSRWPQSIKAGPEFKMPTN
tara:strand:+ start:206 stop:1705 length:1500 start_codon:yes stop_codon:yes gene_type:complete